MASRVQLVLTALVFVVSAPLSCLAQHDENCKLTQDVPAKPDPSLMQCYKFNTLSCCVSGHDSTILGVYSETLSASCLREYPLLEHFFCFGCHPEQPTFTLSNVAEPEIRVCQSLADALFELDLERCGISIGIANSLMNASNPAPDWEIGFHEPSDERQVIIPKKVFKDSETFLNAIKPPYFENYKVVIVPDDGECFSPAGRVISRFFASVLAVFVCLQASSSFSF
ncbi:Hypothetical Protein FCC1311_030252 [Hondaea fermentalgiana]|uniref:Folate receptor-like domain-containing protein n=1 Tax=Hondaea fermentalgiana TaxID=2315210 RepID=A0A2R5GDR7_9STRA|nr:Hypothetical Protein FCC1311_030252 [Hondaea fermentalgiana]|eukprot:GBG26803.1 Hypothetical Protein FCC1311_030252 [Hondaea fermentalgiana]